MERILIIEDDPNINRILKHTLEKEGFETIVATNGFDGLKMAREENPSLIILDIMLPSLTGFEVSALLKRDEQYKKIPIIVLTCLTSELSVKTGEEVGADMYITKPFDMKFVVQGVKDVLNKYKEKNGSKEI